MEPIHSQDDQTTDMVCNEDPLAMDQMHIHQPHKKSLGPLWCMVCGSILKDWDKKCPNMFTAYMQFGEPCNYSVFFCASVMKTYNRYELPSEAICCKCCLQLEEVSRLEQRLEEIRQDVASSFHSTLSMVRSGKMKEVLKGPKDDWSIKDGPNVIEKSDLGIQIVDAKSIADEGPKNPNVVDSAPCKIRIMDPKSINNFLPSPPPSMASLSAAPGAVMTYLLTPQAAPQNVQQQPMGPVGQPLPNGSMLIQITPQQLLASGMGASDKAALMPFSKVPNLPAKEKKIIKVYSPKSTFQQVEKARNKLQFYNPIVKSTTAPIQDKEVANIPKAGAAKILVAPAISSFSKSNLKKMGITPARVVHVKTAKPADKSQLPNILSKHRKPTVQKKPWRCEPLEEILPEEEYVVSEMTTQLPKKPDVQKIQPKIIFGDSELYDPNDFIVRDPENSESNEITGIVFGDSVSAEIQKKKRKSELLARIANDSLFYVTESGKKRIILPAPEGGVKPLLPVPSTPLRKGPKNVARRGRGSSRGSFNCHSDNSESSGMIASGSTDGSHLDQNEEVKRGRGRGRGRPRKDIHRPSNVDTTYDEGSTNERPHSSTAVKRRPGWLSKSETDWHPYKKFKKRRGRPRGSTNRVSSPMENMSDEGTDEMHLSNENSDSGPSQRRKSTKDVFDRVDIHSILNSVTDETVPAELEGCDIDIPLRRSAFNKASKRLQIIARYDKPHQFLGQHDALKKSVLDQETDSDNEPEPKVPKLRNCKIVLSDIMDGKIQEDEEVKKDVSMSSQDSFSATLGEIGEESQQSERQNSAGKSDVDLVCNQIEKVILESPPIVKNVGMKSPSFSNAASIGASDLFICDICKLDFAKLDDLRNHIEQDHFSPTY